MNKNNKFSCERMVGIKYAAISIALLLFPFAFDVLRERVSEFSKNTFAVHWNYIFLYASFAVLGVLLFLHSHFLQKNLIKRYIPLILSAFFMGEAFCLFYTGFSGSFIACFLFVFILLEAIFLKGKA